LYNLTNATSKLFRKASVFGIRDGPIPDLRIRFPLKYHYYYNYCGDGVRFRPGEFGLPIAQIAASFVSCAAAGNFATPILMHLN
jgi:hypothetical protein